VRVRLELADPAAGLRRVFSGRPTRTSRPVQDIHAISAGLCCSDSAYVRTPATAVITYAVSELNSVTSKPVRCKRQEVRSMLQVFPVEASYQKRQL
jgi:hypothetical protein